MTLDTCKVCNELEWECLCGGSKVQAAVNILSAIADDFDSKSKTYHDSYSYIEEYGDRYAWEAREEKIKEDLRKAISLLTDSDT